MLNRMLDEKIHEWQLSPDDEAVFRRVVGETEELASLLTFIHQHRLWKVIDIFRLNWWISDRPKEMLGLLPAWERYTVNYRHFRDKPYIELIPGKWDDVDTQEGFYQMAECFISGFIRDILHGKRGVVPLHVLLTLMEVDFIPAGEWEDWLDGVV